ncbi:response regulator transcription factor [Kitasatospora aureofaciens]|uniref:response regulator transcription factor n=1 Tax=Kitasatospora aureofaciens TaxID=1894 RepID=UPI0037C7D625
MALAQGEVVDPEHADPPGCRIWQRQAPVGRCRGHVHGSWCGLGHPTFPGEAARLWDPAGGTWPARAGGLRVGEPSPTELRVAHLVAAGRSNPQIAAELLLSARTVQSHVSRILAKLSFTSRVEIAGEAARMGLTS